MRFAAMQQVTSLASLHDAGLKLGQCCNLLKLSRPWSSTSAALTSNTPVVHESSSTGTPAQQEQQHEAGKVVRNWDWDWVLGHRRSRKPAIKRPQRHQWHFCNPNYDPHQPLPPKWLPPHAPASAEGLDERKLYEQLKPTHRQRNDQVYKQKFVRWQGLRDVDWRVAFQKGVAQEVKAVKKEQRLAQEEQRQKQWAEYKREVFRQAVAGQQ